MSRWMVNVRGQSFSVGTMDELKGLAKKGDVGGGAIVQPPGASEWLYAVEIPELKASLRPDHLDELNPANASTGFSPAVKGVFAGALILGCGFMWNYALEKKGAIPKDPLTLLDASGTTGMSFDQAMVTGQGLTLKASASTSAADLCPLPNGASTRLLAKRGDWYKISYDGHEGYAPADAVSPAYHFADAKLKGDYDPLYNPDKYLKVGNHSWVMPVDKAKDGVSILQAALENGSKFPMTDIKILAVLTNSTGGVVSEREIAVEGVVPPNGSDQIGTLLPARGDTSPPRILLSLDYEKMVQADPTLAAKELWSDGVEMVLENEETSEGSARIVEVRAIPPTAP